MTEFLVRLRDRIAATFGVSHAVQDRLLTSLVIILALLLTGRLVRVAIHRRTDDVRIRYRWSKTTTYILLPIGVVLVGRVWFEGLGSIATFLGLVSAGVAIALKDVLMNFAGWAFIVWRRPFVVGDRIEVGGHKGDVIDVRMLQFTLLEVGNWVDADQSTGRVIHVPNGKILIEPLANYTMGFQYVWTELPVTITFESDWKAAKAALREIVTEHAPRLGPEVEARIRALASQYLILYQKLDPIIYTRVVAHGVQLTVRYLTEPRARRGYEERMWERILERFHATPGIAFAYPTTRFYDRHAEGPPPGG